MGKTASQNKMGTKPMFPLLMSMSMPAMFSMLIQALYNVVDSIFVSRIGSEALSAVSLAYPMQMIMISFAVGTAVGVNSLIARRLGSKDYKDANDAATHGMVLALINWIIFLLIGIFASRPFLSLFSKNENIVNFGTQYLVIVLTVSLGAMFTCMGEKTLQATGNMIVPMLSQLMGAVINIIFDPLLIFGIGPFPRLEVAGAAIATVFGQICSMTFILIILFKKHHDVRIDFKKFKVKLCTVKNIYVVGVPAIVMQSIGSVMVSGINAIISLSSVAVGIREAYINVFGAYFKLQSFVFMPVFGLSQGTSPIIGYNYGAKNKKRMFSALKISIVIAVVIMFAGLILFQFCSTWLLSLFDADETMFSVGEAALKIISLSFLPAAIGISFSTLFQAVGKGLYSMIMSISRQLVVLLPVAYLLSRIGLSAMWYAFPFSEIVSLVVASVLFINLMKKEFKKLDSPGVQD